MKKVNPIIRFVNRLFGRKYQASELPPDTETPPEREFPADLPIQDGMDDISVPVEVACVMDSNGNFSDSEELIFRPIIERFFAESQKATQPSVILGVDLGTSFSKVVLGHQNLESPVKSLQLQRRKTIRPKILPLKPTIKNLISIRHPRISHD